MSFEARANRIVASALSTVDRHLLALLRQDSRRSYSELAGALKVSRTTVKDRIDRLKEQGVITRFTIEMSSTMAEPSRGILAFFHMQLKRPHCRIVYESIAGWPELVGCWSIAGSTDMTVLINTPSDAELEALRDRLARHPEVKTLWTELCLKQWAHRVPVAGAAEPTVQVP
jgi:Lrp/AsnC family leucine-responsive transcriptional regulator